MIGPKLRQLREERGYSLRKLARMTGLSHSFISDIEHGRCNPSIENLRTLARTLKVKPDFFLRDEVVPGDRNQQGASTLDVSGH